MFGKIKEWLDSIFLSDHEWKKKYCPNLYNYLFEMINGERHAVWEKHKKRNI